jgi:predicted nucleic acid-binding protein
VGTVVLDASVVLGLRDPNDPHHAAASAALRSSRLAGDSLVLPASALAEVLVGASRLGAPAVQRMEKFVDAIIDDVHPIERRAARAAAEYRARHRSLRLPDAFVLAVGEILNASAVLTADQAWQRVDPRVRLIT